MFTEQPLTRYAAQHKPKAVSLIRCLDGSGEVHTTHLFPNGDLINAATVIQTYRRYRDGIRALKALGYEREGRFWRQVPKKELPSPLPAEETTHEGF